MDYNINKLVRNIKNNLFIDKLIFKYKIRDKTDSELHSLILTYAHHLESYGRLTNFSIKTKINRIKILLDEYYKKTDTIDETISWAIIQLLEKEYSLKFEGCNNIIKKEKVKDVNTTLERIIEERRSIRVWNKKKIDENKIIKIINSAKWAPSSCNNQSWKVLFIKNKDKKKLLSYFPNKFYVNAPLILLILGNRKVYGKRETHYMYLDAGAFIQNILLLLHAQNMSACWVGFKAWNVIVPTNIDKNNEFCETLNINKDLVPISLLAIGYNDKNKVNKPPRIIIINR